MPHSYAVLDVETTGFYRSDRIIELALITVSEGKIVQEFCTLLNPNCADLGDPEIHGITIEHIQDAPVFEEIADYILDLLRDRVVVGHNVIFDLRFLRQEFSKLGLQLPSLPSCCTLKLAYGYGPQDRRLSDCCKYFGIDHGSAHSALHDAHASLELMMVYRVLSKRKGSLGWHGAHLPGDKIAVPDCSERSKSSSGVKNSAIEKEKRRCVGQRKKSYIANLVLKLPPVDQFELASYLLVLDRALEDRRIVQNEVEELAACALELGLSLDEVQAAHGEYLRLLIQVALSDGTLSEFEKKELNHVTDLLGFEREYAASLIQQFR